MKKVLVTGSNGQLGTEIRRQAKDFPQLDFVFTDIEDLDLLDLEAVKSFFGKENFHICINCAAYTAVDRAEDEPEQALKLNAQVPEQLAALCDENGGLLIHISTDYVFNGTMHRPYTEEDLPCPASAYGISKHKGEEAVFEKCRRTAVVRTAWLCSAHGNNFVKTMLRLGKEKGEIGVVSDQVGTPTFASDLAGAVLKLATELQNKEVREIYHYSNEGAISWYDFAVAIMEEAALDCKVNAIESKDFPTKATRPFYSVLNKSKIKEELKLEIPYWRDSLRKLLNEMKKAKR